MAGPAGNQVKLNEKLFPEKMAKHKENVELYSKIRNVVLAVIVGVLILGSAVVLGAQGGLYQPQNLNIGNVTMWFASGIALAGIVVLGIALLYMNRNRRKKLSQAKSDQQDALVAEIQIKEYAKQIAALIEKNQLTLKDLSTNQQKELLVELRELLAAAKAAEQPEPALPDEAAPAAKEPFNEEQALGIYKALLALDEIEQVEEDAQFIAQLNAVDRKSVIAHLDEEKQRQLLTHIRTLYSSDAGNGVYYREIYALVAHLAHTIKSEDAKMLADLDAARRNPIIAKFSEERQKELLAHIRTLYRDGVANRVYYRETYSNLAHLAETITPEDAEMLAELDAARRNPIIAQFSEGKKKELLEEVRKLYPAAAGDDAKAPYREMVAKLVSVIDADLLIALKGELKEAAVKALPVDQVKEMFGLVQDRDTTTAEALFRRLDLVQQCEILKTAEGALLAEILKVPELSSEKLLAAFFAMKDGIAFLKKLPNDKVNDIVVEWIQDDDGVQSYIKKYDQYAAVIADKLDGDQKAAVKEKIKVYLTSKELEEKFYFNTIKMLYKNGILLPPEILECIRKSNKSVAVFANTLCSQGVIPLKTACVKAMLEGAEGRKLMDIAYEQYSTFNGTVTPEQKKKFIKGLCQVEKFETELSKRRGRTVNGMIDGKRRNVRKYFLEMIKEQ